MPCIVRIVRSIDDEKDLKARDSAYNVRSQFLGFSPPLPASVRSRRGVSGRPERRVLVFASMTIARVAMTPVE